MESIDEIQSQIVALQAKLNAAKAAQRKDDLKKVAELVALHGFTQEEISEAVAKGVKTDGKASRAKPAPKYRNPANEAEQWTGRGQQPQWLVAALAANPKKKLKDFLIA